MMAGGSGPAASSSIKPVRPPTLFETRVYAATSSIPRGRVTTYGAMAAVLGTAPRAVGQALKRNPFAPRVPCHRVVAAGAALGGFSGEWGAASLAVSHKADLLRGEGVEVRDGGRVAPGAVLDADALKAAMRAAGCD